MKKEYALFGISKIEEVSKFGWTETFKNFNLKQMLSRIAKLSNNEEYTTQIFKENFNLKYAENF